MAVKNSTADNKIIQELINRALKMRESSYCPYSDYAVGACVQCADGHFHDGCNIENASYGLTICAERTAIFKAVSSHKAETENDKNGSFEIVRIAIAGGKKGEEPSDYAYPCGACRQVMREFGNENMEIIIAKSVDDYKITTLGEMLPDSFGPDHLKDS